MRSKSISGADHLDAASGEVGIARTKVSSPPGRARGAGPTGRAGGSAPCRPGRRRRWRARCLRARPRGARCPRRPRRWPFEDGQRAVGAVAGGPALRASAPGGRRGTSRRGDENGRADQVAEEREGPVVQHVAAHDARHVGEDRRRQEEHVGDHVVEPIVTNAVIGKNMARILPPTSSADIGIQTARHTSQLHPIARRKI